MDEWTEEEQKRIIKQFHRYCYNIVQHEAINWLKSKNANSNSFLFLEDLSKEDVFANSFNIPEYPNTMFSLGKNIFTIKDPDLAESLQKLSPYRQDIILLYYFLELTEKEIAMLFRISRQAINKQKKNVLLELKKSMEEAIENEG